MKAILVIDIPNEFANREPYFVEGTLFYYIDNPYTNYRYAFNIDKTKLKPLPQKIEGYIDYEYGDGWNDCIDEIIGGEKK